MSRALPQNGPTQSEIGECGPSWRDWGKASPDLRDSGGWALLWSLLG